VIDLQIGPGTVIRAWPVRRSHSAVEKANRTDQGEGYSPLALEPIRGHANWLWGLDTPGEISGCRWAKLILVVATYAVQVAETDASTASIAVARHFCSALPLVEPQPGWALRWGRTAHLPHDPATLIYQRG